jgi:hypothetical protein
MITAVATQDTIYGDAIDDIATDIGVGGVLEFWDGTIPATCEDPDTGTMVVSCALASPAIIIATGLTATMGSIGVGTAVAAGTVVYARAKDSGGTCILQFTCGTGSEEIVFNTNVFAVSDTCTVGTITVTGVIS